ncbi:MAG: hypothetical protein IOC01_15705, partial [Methylobacterium sp.]|nr:hypothetical protein [Methylobacterium sp.]
MDRTWLIDRHNELKTLRQPEERLWKQIAELLRPDDQDFQGKTSNNSAMDEILDSTPLYALEDFTGGMFGQLTNPANDWFGLGIADEELMLYQPVKQWFWTVKQRIRATLGPTMSSFYTEVPSWFADTGAFGIGTLYSEEEIGRGSFLDRAIPLRELYIDTDAAGRISAVHREFTLRGRQVLQQFPGTLNVKEDREYTIIHAVMENLDVKPGRIGPAGMAWASAYLSPD